MNIFQKLKHLLNFANNEFNSDVDECRNHKHQCDVTSTTCSNNVGSYVCNCKAGYQYSSAVKCVGKFEFDKNKNL